MASARTITITKREVTLTLSEEEAGVIRAVAQFIAGDPSKTRRGLFERIDEALGDAGISFDLSDVQGNSDIRFKDRN